MPSEPKQAQATLSEHAKVEAPTIKFSFEVHYDHETLHVEGDCMPADLAGIVDTARAALWGDRKEAA